MPTSSTGRIVRETVKWLRHTAPIRLVDNLSPFIPISRLCERFSNDLDDILNELFDDSERPPNKAILNGGTCFIGIFAILLLIEQPKLILEFLTTRNLSDRQCPFEGGRPANFPPDVIWEEFEKQQWQFFPHTFDGHRDDVEIGDDVALPFTQKEKIASGGSANIYKIIVHKDYDSIVSYWAILD